MYDPDIHSVRSGNYHTLTIVTPVAKKEPGDYNGLINKPQLNGIELIGNVTFEDLGLPADLADVPTEPLSNDDLDNLINS